MCLLQLQNNIGAGPATVLDPVLKTSVRLTTSVSVCVSHSVMWPHGLQPTRFLCLGNSPGKNTGVGCYCLLQRIFPTQGSSSGLLHCRQILYGLSHHRSATNRTAKVGAPRGSESITNQRLRPIGNTVIAVFYLGAQFCSFSELITGAAERLVGSEIISQVWSRVLCAGNEPHSSMSWRLKQKDFHCHSAKSWAWPCFPTTIAVFHTFHTKAGCGAPASLSAVLQSSSSMSSACLPSVGKL